MFLYMKEPAERRGRIRAGLIPFLLALSLAACDSGGGGGGSNLGGGGTDAAGATGALPRVDEANCNVDIGRFIDGGVPPDGIPALLNPKMVGKDEIGSFLADDSRVIGFFSGSQAIAVPHNILWWHEISNMDVEGAKLAVTYCPLTGSSMAFDRAIIDGRTFGVSGLLFQNNQTMYDRSENVSLWPQMNRSAGCGARTGTKLKMYPVLEMTWAGWKSLHPDTRVVSSETGFSRNYTPTGYPYGNYEDVNNASLLDSRTGIDQRRPPKERALGIPTEAGGLVFPFGILDETGAPVRVVRETVGGETIVVIWDSARRGAMAYRPQANGQALTFTVDGGIILDNETGSQWRVDGQAVAGSLTGAQLEPVADAYVAFWFAWAVFQPDIKVWTGDGT